jgi:hypothetical protein
MYVEQWNKMLDKGDLTQIYSSKKLRGTQIETLEEAQYLDAAHSRLLQSLYDEFGIESALRVQFAVKKRLAEILCDFLQNPKKLWLLGRTEALKEELKALKPEVETTAGKQWAVLVKGIKIYIDPKATRVIDYYNLCKSWQ